MLPVRLMLGSLAVLAIASQAALGQIAAALSDRLVERESFRRRALGLPRMRPPGKMGSSASEASTSSSPTAPGSVSGA